MATPAQDEWLQALRDQLLPALARADLHIDLRARLNLETWIDAAQQRGQFPATPGGLRNVLRAIVCKSQRDQVRFDEVFTTWQADLGAAAPVGAPGTTALAVVDVVDGGLAGSIPPWAMRLAGALLVLLAIAATWGLYDWLGNRPPSPPPVAEQAPSVPRAEEGSPPGFDLSKVKPVTTPIEILQPADERPPWLLGIPPAWYAGLVLILAAAGLAVRSTRRAQIARISVDARQTLRELEMFARHLLPVSGARRRALRDAARALRRPVAAEGRWLDVPASVQASASAAGRFVPAYRARQATPEYLALIDRSRPGEPFAQLALEMVRGLAAEGVAILAYEFDRDPRWVALISTDRQTATGTRRRYEPLAGLAARHAGQGLLVFGDGQGFVDPATATLGDWVAPSFAAWPRRALLTPVPISGWGALEDVLAGEGQAEAGAAASFLLLPAQTDALPALAEGFRGGEPQLELLPGAPGPLPPLLHGSNARWLSPHPPDDATGTELLRQLQSHLGPTTYMWLAASAAYPHLSADLTRCLARGLGSDDALSVPAAAAPMNPAPPDPRLLEARLVALARLPWFRQGLMPDWLRSALLRSMPPGVLARIQEILGGLFDTAGGSAALGGISLGRIATDAPAGILQRWRARLRDWQRRRLLGGLAEDEPEDSPLRDVIYLGVLRGSFDPTLALDARDPMLEAMRGRTGPRLSRNPLRWLAALLVLLVFPLTLTRWGTERVLRRLLPRPQPPAPAQRQAADAAAAPKESLAAMPPLPRIFISHARDDAPVVAALVRALREQAGVEAMATDWAAHTENMKWWPNARVPIDQCSAFFPLVSPGYWSSRYCERELRFAFERGAPVMPLLVVGEETADGLTSLPEWAAALATLHHLQLPSELDAWRLGEAAEEIARFARETSPRPGREAASA